MLGFWYRRLLLRFSSRTFLGELSESPFFGAPIVRSFCLQIGKDKQPFAERYLINSLGFSQKAAALAIRRGLRFKTPDGPDAVLALLRDNGLSASQISKVIGRRPEVLSYDAKSILLPKIDFFYSMGLSRTQVVHLISSQPSLLCRSLKDRIIPWYTFLKSLLNLNEKVIIALKSPSWSLPRNVQDDFAPNIAFLRDLGVPESRISFLVIKQPRALTVERKEFEKLVMKIIEMGFQAYHLNFVNAIIAHSGYKTSTLQQKKYILRNWGFSDDDIETTFKLKPLVMFISEKKMERGIDFLVKRMGWSPADVARNSHALCYSLEKRLIPRCSVIRVLQSKGLIKDGMCLHYILSIVEQRFLDKFVNKFKQDIPELLGVYQGKVAALELIGKSNFLNGAI